jgi:hypothetical protein
LATQSKMQKLKKRPKSKSLNIGTFVFGILIIYIIVNFILFLSSSHITAYTVIKGSLVDTTTYRAIAVRTEEIQMAERAGNIGYYAKENEKIGVGSLVYSIDEGGRLNAALESSYMDGEGLSTKDYAEIRALVTNYTLNFSNTQFYSLYNFKNELEGNLLDFMNVRMLENIDTLTSAGSLSNTFIKYHAPKEGIVGYSLDGMENITINSLNEQHFEGGEPTFINLRNQSLVNAGAPVYKLITDENWQIAFPIEEGELENLQDLTYMKFRFLKDGIISSGKFSIVNNGSLTLGVIELDSGIIRYCNNRYIEVELLLNDETGLKIPNSAIVEKNFYVVPKDYITNGGNQNEAGFLRQVVLEDGSPSIEFIATTIYAENTIEYYIDMVNFKSGDILVKPDSVQTYTISKLAPLQGVYNINMAYAVFQQIRIIDQNEEYTIVAQQTRYDLSQYDNIVLDGTSVDEEDIVY